MESDDLAQMATSIVIAMLEARIIHDTASVLTAIDDVKRKLSGMAEPISDDIPEGLENVLR